MGVIEVNAIKVFAHHGCLQEEAAIGGYYRVDVRIEGDFRAAEQSDDLGETVDYGRVGGVVHEQMASRSRLIEHVARRILDGLKAEWPRPYRWQVRVVKLRPPIQGDVEEASYCLEG
jgi:dihydroneopterin aldolase